MRNVLRDRGVRASLAAVVPLVLATVFAPSLVLVVVALWVVWAVVTGLAIAGSVRRPTQEPTVERRDLE